LQNQITILIEKPFLWLLFYFYRATMIVFEYIFGFFYLCLKCFFKSQILSYFLTRWMYLLKTSVRVFCVIPIAIGRSKLLDMLRYYH